jgi:hypothetical protein
LRVMIPVPLSDLILGIPAGLSRALHPAVAAVRRGFVQIMDRRWLVQKGEQFIHVAAFVRSP